MRKIVNLVVAVVLASLVLLPAAPPAAASGCADVFPASFVRALAGSYPGLRITAAVYDVRTRCWYHLHRELRVTTASVIKAGILAAELLRAQDAHRALTPPEQGRTAAMIRLSHNPETSQLYAEIGGPGGLHRYESRLGATGETRYAAAFGGTLTSARDRTLVSLRLLRGGGALLPAGRAAAWRYMSTVDPTQRWGVSAGVRSGYDVALKNGFYPMRGNGWRVGSTGFVRARGTDGGYAITVLTDRGADQLAGVRAVETVSRRVAGLLTGRGPVAPRPVDSAVCTRTSAGESWVQVATRLGLPPSKAVTVRSLSGGNDAPLSGQRACSPAPAS